MKYYNTVLCKCNYEQNTNGQRGHLSTTNHIHDVKSSAACNVFQLHLVTSAHNL